MASKYLIVSSCATFAQLFTGAAPFWRFTVYLGSPILALYCLRGQPRSGTLLFTGAAPFWRFTVYLGSPVLALYCLLGQPRSGAFYVSVLKKEYTIFIVYE